MRRQYEGLVTAGVGGQDRPGTGQGQAGDRPGTCRRVLRCAGAGVNTQLALGALAAATHTHKHGVALSPHRNPGPSSVSSQLPRGAEPPPHRHHYRL